MVGARILGYEPSDVPHLVHAAKNRKRPLDLSDVEIAGDKIETLASYHEYDFPFNEEETLPMFMARAGIKGVNYRKYDLTHCTYCADLYPVILAAVAKGWKGEPWNGIEVLTGKIMKSSPGMQKTVLVGKCIYEHNKDDVNIQEMIAVKECPPRPKEIVKALHKAGINTPPAVLEKWQ